MTYIEPTPPGDFLIRKQMPMAARPQPVGAE